MDCFVQQRSHDIAGCNQATVKSSVTLGNENYGRGFKLSRKCITKLNKKYQMDNVIIAKAVAKTVKNLIPVRVLNANHIKRKVHKTKIIAKNVNL